ncbi:MAG: histidine phosphatase family protein [Planctomycetota bacterium]
MPREIWLVRHGVTESNRASVIQGQTDSPLAPAGVEQAERLAAWLQARGERFDRLVASPLQRARRTAEALAAQLEVEIEIDPRWMEASYGELEGRPGAELQPLRALPEPEARVAAPAGGESMADLEARVVGALRDWTGRLADGERLLVATHGGPIGALVAHVMGLAYSPQVSRRFRRDNTGVTVLRDRASAPLDLHLALLNSVDHLREAAGG